ncbi:hypothetical protein [Lederbergia citrea]|uniref:hypothetical protein n=1 Tax=Lederbergia citrea TaxID=2833581 RepID=UPI001BC9CA24|nr:hypothetical protein [Lederbergia citrea]MBS4206314.1 hypothetical protein [Lederbergia citrea]
MANVFKQNALSNVRYNPDLHRAHSISENDEVIKRILSSIEVEAFMSINVLDLDNTRKHNI